MGVTEVCGAEELRVQDGEYLMECVPPEEEG